MDEVNQIDSLCRVCGGPVKQNGAYKDHYAALLSARTIMLLTKMDRDPKRFCKRCCVVMLRSNKAAAEGKVYIQSAEQVEWCEHTVEGCKVCEILSRGRKLADQQNNGKEGVDKQALTHSDWGSEDSTDKFLPRDARKAFASGANNPWDQPSWCGVPHLWGTIRSTSTATLWFSNLCGLCSLHSEVANSDMNIVVFTCTLVNRRFGTCQKETCPHCHSSHPLKILPPTDMLANILGRVLVACPTYQQKVSLCNLKTRTVTKCEEGGAVQDIPISDILADNTSNHSWSTCSSQYC